MKLSQPKIDLRPFANKLTEKIPDPSNNKEYYQSYLKKKTKKLVKRSKKTFQQPKTIENPNTVDIKSAIIKHQKTSNKFTKTIGKAEKVSQVSCAENSLYSETEKNKNFLN